MQWPFRLLVGRLVFNQKISVRIRDRLQIKCNIMALKIRCTPELTEKSAKSFLNDIHKNSLNKESINFKKEIEKANKILNKAKI